CAIHQRRGAPPPPASSLMEQHLVSALLVRRHQLHAPLELRDLCGARLVHRRLCHYHLSPSRPDLSNSAARLLAGMIEKPPQPVVYDDGGPQIGDRELSSCLHFSSLAQLII